MQAIMTREVVQVAPDAPLAELVSRMSGSRISCVLVCDDGRPVGVVSERDLVRVAQDLLVGRAFPERAADLMSQPVETICQDGTLEEAAAKVGETPIRRLPVVDDAGTLVGIVTQTDILAAYATMMEARVAERTAELSEANARLEGLSRLDGLLGIGNRRAMDEALAVNHGLALRYGRSWSVVLADVDHFKAYNDAYGHPAGDSALKQVSDAIVDELRGPDQLFRYGGEEFLALLPETDGVDARAVAERLANRIRSLRIEHASSEAGILTVSFGVAAARAGAPEPDHMGVLQAADEALYRAKEQGRDRVVAAGDGAEASEG